MRTFISFLFAWVLVALGLLSDLHAAPSVEISRRVVGLFEPSRVEDLKEIIPTLPGVELVRVDYVSTVAVWRVDPALLMTNYNATKPPLEEQLVQRLDSLLGAATNRTFTLKPLSSIAADKTITVELHTHILDCRGCRYAVYNGIAKLEGVESATVGKDGLIAARINSSKTDQKTLDAALKKIKGLEHP